MTEHLSGPRPLNELELVLKKAGLPYNPKQVIGRLYQFECEHGSHNHVLVGTVLAIEISDEGGLELYVSNPIFWGKKLTSIMHNNGKWMAYVANEPLSKDEEDRTHFMADGEYEGFINDQIASRFFVGEFELL